MAFLLTKRPGMLAGSPPVSSPLWAKLLLATLSPVVFLGFTELVIWATGVNYELTQNDNFEVAIPAWLLADDNYASGVEPGMKSDNVEWLNHFTEARYIWTKAKPNVDVEIVNPFTFNAIEALAGRVTFHFSSNSDGFRSPEFTPKEPGVIRIVCIGDSSTFGWGVDYEYTYPHLIETRVAGLGPRVEVFNLGIPGYTSRHGLGVLRHYALELDADYYVFSFGANDPRLLLRNVDEVLSQDEGLWAALRFSVLKLRTFLFLRSVVFQLSDPTLRYEPSDLVRAVTDEQYVENMHTLVSIARERGARAAFLAVCAPLTMVHQMRDVAEAADVSMVDAGALFVERYEDLQSYRVYADEIRYSESVFGLDAMKNNWRLYVTTDGCHPNRAGMSLIADELVEALMGVAPKQ